MVAAPSLTLNDDQPIPQIGFGVFEIPPEETKRVVLDALAAGYRHIDTAAAYFNEAGVGAALAESGLARDEIFVTTKQRPNEQSRDVSRDAIMRSLDALGLDHVDLYLIHWPVPSRDEYVESWLALEQFAAEGLTRSIGVSNFLPEHLDRVLAAGSTIPVVNQIELHPRLQQREIQDYCAEKGIVVEAWSPLARGDLVNTPAVLEIAARHSKTVAQVMLRWHLHSGRIPLPRTRRPERMAENFAVFDFILSPEEIAAIDALESDARIGPHPALKT